MALIRKHLKLLGVAASCAALGAGAGAIADAGAANSAHASRLHPHANRAFAAGLRFRVHRLLARAVHGDAVVDTPSGFQTVTYDRGTVQSVNGQQLTLAEGTRSATYKTVTLTIPADARVRDDGHNATLADVKQGQRAIVLQGPSTTLVVAR